MVRYHNSGTQKFDDTEHKSVKTDGLENGVAGDGNIIDGLHGSSGENHTIGFMTYVPTDTVSISTTTFSELGSDPERLILIYHDDVSDLTNMSGDLQHRLHIRVGSTVDQNATIRPRNSPNAEISISTSDAFNTFVSGWDSVDSDIIFAEGELETQTNGDSVSIRNMVFEFGKEVGVQ